MKQSEYDRSLEIKSYLKDLYENTPIFDEIPPSYTSSKRPWERISQYILSPFDHDKEKLIKYVKSSHVYIDQINSNDALI